MADAAHRILLVEDNEMNRDMLSRRLMRRGFTVLFALDGAQAVEMAEAEQPDLILMDMNLPVMDGWEATRLIKAAPATSGIPVIALTAHAMTGDADHALAAGCDAFETKPIEFGRLTETMDRMIADRQGRLAPGSQSTLPARGDETV